MTTCLPGAQVRVREHERDTPLYVVIRKWVQNDPDSDLMPASLQQPDPAGKAPQVSLPPLPPAEEGGGEVPPPPREGPLPQPHRDPPPLDVRLLVIDLEKPCYAQSNNAKGAAGFDSRSRMQGVPSLLLRLGLICRAAAEAHAPRALAGRAAPRARAVRAQDAPLPQPPQCAAAAAAAAGASCEHHAACIAHATGSLCAAAGRCTHAQHSSMRFPM